MTKITKRVVDSVQPSGKEVFLWDDETAGFGLRVKLTGAKSFIIQYRNAQGRSRRLTLGRYGVLTVEEARRKARLSLSSVLKGEDPAENKLLERGALTVADLCGEYLAKAERGLILTKRGDTKKASTLYTDRGRIERHIIPLIEKRTVKDLTTATWNPSGCAASMRATSRPARTPWRARYDSGYDSDGAEFRVTV